LSRICRAEGVEASGEALASIARAAEGSARDALSLLDQAIAHGAGVVTADTVRDMLGLADRSQVIDLFEAAMRGDVPAAFALLRAQYDAGADPAVILTDLAAFTHIVTRLKLVPEAARDPALTEIERARGGEFAAKLSVRALSRAWQILLRGIPEVQAANRPVAAAEMVLVRLAYAADLPTPDEALRALKDGSPLTAAANAAETPARSPGPAASNRSGQVALASDSPPQPRPAPEEPAPGLRLRFEDVVALAGERREIMLKAALERDVRLVRFEEGQIEFNLVEGGNRAVATDLARALQNWTGRRWMVALSSEPGAPTLHEQAQAAARERKEGAASHPLVQAVLTRFPGAKVVNVIDKGAAEAEPGGGAETAILGEADAVAAQEAEADDDL
jgi:DNA polymerase-3 subunit gamma/tau